MAYHASFSAEQLRSGSSRIPAITTRIIGLVGTCAILAASVSACRSTKTGTPSDLTTRQASLPGTLETKESWDALSPEVRFEILDSEYRTYPSLKLTDPKDPETLSSPKEKALSEKMLSYMKSTTDLRIEDKAHGQIGSLQTSVRILLLNGETILGGDVRFSQKGCVMPDHTAPRFATEAQAKKAGCEMSEQNVWQAVGQFNHDGVPFAVSDFIEWMGN